MDGKGFGELNELDQRLKRAFRTGMMSRARVTIQLTTAFEQFNTRAFHNYETWSSGYHALIHEDDAPEGVEEWERRVEAEDLDVLVERIESKLNDWSRKAQEEGAK